MNELKQQEITRTNPEGLCICFDYINKVSDEGICSLDYRIVNINEGCKNPLSCEAYKRFLRLMNNIEN